MVHSTCIYGPGQHLENAIRASLPHVEVLTHLEPLEDPKSWDDPGKPLAGS